MTWFRVDDQLHSHVKTTDVSAAAMGLWVMAGSWASAQLSDGFIPARAAARLYPEAEQLAAELVAARLWHEDVVDGRTGWSFHSWGDHQPSAESVHRDRAAARERQRRAREGAAAARAAAAEAAEVARAAAASRGASRRDAGVSHGSVTALVTGTPTPPVTGEVTPEVTGGSRGESRSPRPDPTRPEGGDARAGAKSASVAGSSGPPPRRCQRHLGLTDPGPCPGCADARRARDDFDADAAARPTPSAWSPPCPVHPEHPASRCPACAQAAVPAPGGLRDAIRRTA